MRRTRRVVRCIAYALLTGLCALLLIIPGWPEHTKQTPEYYWSSAPQAEITPLAPMPHNWLLNAGTLEQLDELPGIGPVYASRIIESREKDGPFYFPEDVMEVKGIGEKRFEQIMKWLQENPQLAFVTSE